MNDRQIITEDIVCLARQNPDLAFERVNQLVDEQPNEYWTWSLRSYVYNTRGDFQNAMADIDKAISIEFNDPSNHQEKAMLFFDNDSINQAIDSFSDAIIIGNSIDISYYESYCRFMRAFCYCRIGNFVLAAQDLHMVDDDDAIWIDRLRTKAELLEACRNKCLE